MAVDKLKIIKKQGKSGLFKGRVFINGTELHGVTSLSLNLDTSMVNYATVTFIVDPEIIEGGDLPNG